MKILRNLAFTFVVVLGLSIAVSAQKNDQKKPPRKEGKPPVVTPRDKKPPKENPKGGHGNRGKRPGMSWVIETEESIEI